MHLSTLAAGHDAWVVVGRRHHAEHFARRWLNGHDAADLSLHESLAECLQLYVDAEREVLAGNGLLVEGTVLIATLDAAVGVAQEYLDALLSAQLLLIAALHAELTDVVAGLIVVVFLDVAGRHLSHIAQHMGGMRILVLADAALLHVEAREAEHLLLEHAELLVGELAHEELLREARVAGILRTVLDVVHALYEEFLRDAQRLAELQRVEVPALFVHDDHDVVGGLVVDEELSVSVGDDASRGVFNLLQERVGVGILLVVVAEQLQRE